MLVLVVVGDQLILPLRSIFVNCVVLHVTARNGLKKHYVTQHHMKLLHGDDTPTAILPGELPALLQKVRAGQRHRVVSPVPAGDDTLLDTATGGQPASPPPPPPATQGVTKLRATWGPVHPVNLFVANERDIFHPTRKLQEGKTPPGAGQLRPGVRSTPYPRRSPRTSGSNSPIFVPGSPSSLSLTVAVPKGTRSVAQQPDVNVTSCVKNGAAGNTAVSAPLPSLGARLKERTTLQPPYCWDMPSALSASRGYPGMSSDQIYRKYLEQVGKNSHPQMARIRELIQTVVAIRNATTADIFKILDLDPYDLPEDQQDRLRRCGISFRVASGKDYTNRDIRYVGASRSAVQETSSTVVEEASLIDFDSSAMEIEDVEHRTPSPVSFKDLKEVDLFFQGHCSPPATSASEGIYIPVVGWL